MSTKYTSIQHTLVVFLLPWCLLLMQFPHYIPFSHSDSSPCHKLSKFSLQENKVLIQILKFILTFWQSFCALSFVTMQCIPFKPKDDYLIMSLVDLWGEERHEECAMWCALLCCWLDVTNNTMVVANKKSKCLKRNNGWKSLSLLFVTDYHYLSLRNGLRYFITRFRLLK